MGVNVAHVETRRVGDPDDRLRRNNYWRGQEAAFSTDLDPVWTRLAPGGVRRWEDDRIELRRS